MGDDKAVLHYLTEAAQASGFTPSHLSLFPMPTVDDITAHLLNHDVVWVFGGSVAGLLAMWRLHDVDAALHTAWQAGVVLTGISAGSICWHAGGTTDSFGPQLQPVTNGLGFLPYANGVHYDSEDQRRRSFNGWSARECCLLPTPPTMARACCTEGRNSQKHCPSAMAPQPISLTSRMVWSSRLGSTPEGSNLRARPSAPR